MIEVRASIDIAASADTVWNVLTDLAQYPAWNPFIRHARGSLALGGDVRVRVRPHLGIPLAFRARITHREEGRELRWRGTVGGRWIGSGDHDFVITPLDDHRARFEQVEVFDGIVPHLGARVLEREARLGFEAMNRALADRAERAELALATEHPAIDARKARA